MQQLGADACLAEMPVDGFVSVARIPDQGKAKRRHLGADLVGLSGEQLHLQKRAVLIGFQKPPARADGNRSGVGRFFLIDSDLIAVFFPQKPALRKSAGGRLSRGEKPVEFAQAPVSDQLAHLLAPGQRFPADHQAAGVPVQPVADGRPEGGKLLLLQLPARQQIVRQPFIQGVIPRLRLLRQKAGRLVRKKHLAVLVQNGDGKQFLFGSLRRGGAGTAECRFPERRTGFPECRDRSPELFNGLVRKKKADPVSHVQLLAPVRPAAVQRDVLFPEHFIKETASGFLQIFFQIFVKPLSALVGADGHFSHEFPFTCREVFRASPRCRAPEWRFREIQMEIALIRENTAPVCVSSAASSLN